MGQYEHGNMWITPTLYRIARKLPPNPKVVLKDQTDSRHKSRAEAYRLTEEQIVCAIVRHMRGESIRILVEELGVSEDVFRKWRNGINRPKCLMEAEKRYANIVAAGP